MYSFLRFIIAFLLAVLFYFIAKKKWHHSMKGLLFLTIVIGITIFGTISAIPFEDNVMRFNSPEEALSYVRPDLRISKVIKQDDFAAIFTTEDGFTLDCSILRKANGSWKLDSTGSREYKRDGLSNVSATYVCPYSLYIVEKSSEEVFVVVSEIQSPTKEGVATISDKQNTEFKSLVIQGKLSEAQNLYYVYHYAFVHEAFDAYQIVINGETL